MKVIEIENDMYDSLVSLANEMLSQDPRCTRMPHIFQIRDFGKVYDWGLNGDTRIWINDYQTEIESLQDLLDYLNDNNIPYEEPFMKDLWENDYDFGLPDWVEYNCPHLKECTYSLEPRYINAFLTAKAAQEHLARNRHHYHTNADVYLNHAWRNPEAELVTKFLCSLIGKEIYI